MIDTNSSTWLFVKKTAEEMIARAQRELEVRGTAPDATEFERGRIKALRDILALADPKPAIKETVPFI